MYVGTNQLGRQVTPSTQSILSHRLENEIQQPQVPDREEDSMTEVSRVDLVGEGVLHALEGVDMMVSDDDDEIVWNPRYNNHCSPHFMY